MAPCSCSFATSHLLLFPQAKGGRRNVWCLSISVGVNTEITECNIGKNCAQPALGSWCEPATEHHLPIHPGTLQVSPFMNLNDLS